MKINLNVDLAILISIITVFLFATGHTYIAGYLNAFNINPIVLNYSVQDKIYIGYLRGFNIYIYTILVVMVFIAAKVLWVTFDISRKINYWLNKRINVNSKKFTPTIHNSSFHDELEQTYSKNMVTGLSIIIILIGSLFALANVEKKATEKAFSDIKELKFATVSIKKSKIKNTHKVILCGPTLCAIMDKEKSVTLEETKSLEFPPKKPPKSI